MDVKESAAKADPVARAVAAIRGAQDRLVSLPVSKEDPVSRKAAAALQAQDPPPIWPLTEALLKAQDAGFRLRLIQVQAAIGPAEPIRVVVALGEAVKAEKDMTIKHAILNAMVEVGTGLQQACGELDRGDRPGTRSAASQRDQAPPDPGPGGRGGRPERRGRGHRRTALQLPIVLLSVIAREKAARRLPDRNPVPGLWRGIVKRVITHSKADGPSQIDTPGAPIPTARPRTRDPSASSPRLPDDSSASTCRR